MHVLITQRCLLFIWVCTLTLEFAQAKCPYPENIPFGELTLVYGDGVKYGSQVEYACRPGFQMVRGTNKRHCLIYGWWSGDLPVCEVLQSPTLKVMISSNEDVVKEHKATFSCFASLFSPPVHEITWQRNGQEILSGSDVKTSSFEAERNANGTLYNAISHLQVKDTDWTDGHPTITCVFQGFGGNVSKSVTHDANEQRGTHDANEQRRNCDNPDENLMRMEILPPSIEELFYNKKTLLVCEVLELVATVDAVTWQDEAGTTLPNAENKASLDSLRGGKRLFRVAVEVFYEEWNKGIHYYCVAEHKSLLFAKEMTFERSNGGLFKRPSVFLLPPVEQTSQNMVTLVCYVRDFYPREVAVSWLINDEPVETDSTDYAFNTTNLMENKGVFSVYGQLTFSDALWRKTEAMYSCVVYHESMINTTRIIVRSMVERTADKP